MKRKRALSIDKPGGLFANRLKNEFGLLKTTELRAYTNDLKTNMVKENKSGIMDFLLNSDVNSDLNNERSKLMSRSTVKSGLTANFYTAFFWETKSAKGLGSDNIVHDGLYNYIWAVVEVQEGQKLYNYVPATLEMLQNNNTYYLLYFYYEALNEGTHIVPYLDIKPIKPLSSKGLVFLSPYLVYEYFANWYHHFKE